MHKGLGIGTYGLGLGLEGPGLGLGLEGPGLGLNLGLGLGLEGCGLDLDLGLKMLALTASLLPSQPCSSITVLQSIQAATTNQRNKAKVSYVRKTDH